MRENERESKATILRTQMDLHSPLCSTSFLLLQHLHISPVSSSASHFPFFLFFWLLLFLWVCVLFFCVCSSLGEYLNAALHLHREIYTISLILKGYDDLVWKTKSKKPYFSSVQFSVSSMFWSVSLYTSIYTRSCISHRTEHTNTLVPQHQHAHIFNKYDQNMNIWQSLVGAHVLLFKSIAISFLSIGTFYLNRQSCKPSTELNHRH